MFAAIGAFFRAIEQLFLGAEKYATALNKTGDVAIAKAERWTQEEMDKMLQPVVIDAEEPKRIAS